MLTLDEIAPGNGELSGAGPTHQTDLRSACQRSLKAALLAPDGSPASLREFMASVSTLIHDIGPCYDMPHDEQVQIIEMIATAMRTRLLSK